MLEALVLVGDFVAGLGLGLIFFGGLWWTVRQGLRSNVPQLWFFFSLPIRMGVTLAGLFAVFGGHWERLTVCLVGLLVSRAVVTRFAGSPTHSPTPEVVSAP